MLSTPASTAPTSALISSLSLDCGHPLERLDIETVKQQLDREHEGDLDRVEELLASLEELKQHLVVTLYQRFIDLQSEHRQGLVTLDAKNEQREWAEACNKQKLALFLDDISTTFAGLFGSAPQPPLLSQNPASDALVLVDPNTPVRTFDKDALTESVRVGETEDLDALEDILEGIHTLFDACAVAIVRQHERLDVQRREALDQAMRHIKETEEEQARERQSIATLCETVRSAFENFQAQPGF